MKAYRLSSGKKHYVKRLPRSVCDYGYSTTKRRALNLTTDQAATFTRYCQIMGDPNFGVEQ